MMANPKLLNNNACVKKLLHKAERCGNNCLIETEKKIADEFPASK